MIDIPVVLIRHMYTMKDQKARESSAPGRLLRIGSFCSGLNSGIKGRTVLFLILKVAFLLFCTNLQYLR